MYSDPSRIHAAARDEVLRRCYLRPDHEAPICSGDICQAFGLSEVEFRRHVFEDLIVGYRVREVVSGPCEESGRGFGFMIGFNGIVEVESRRLVDPAVIAEHIKARNHVLHILGAWHRTHPLVPWRDLEDLLTPEHEPWMIERARDYLLQAGAIQGDELLGIRLRINEAGLSQLRDLERQDALAARFEAIQDLKPQERGRALEGLLADALRLQILCCHEDAGGDGEQIDLVVESDAGFFLCEAKWLTDRVEPKVVNELSGRLDSRPSFVVGVIFSMSDFTPAARTRATSMSKQRTILLIGEEDSRAILSNERQFEDIVRSQLRSLVKRGTL